MPPVLRSMPQSTDKWPRWPEDAKGKPLVNLGVAWDVDTLFRTMFGSASTFMVG